MTIASIESFKISNGVENPLSTVEMLIVAGGGGGGRNQGGGGGAGGVVFNTNALLIKGKPYTITVGAGGSGSASNNPTNGSNSFISGQSFYGANAIGGGSGGTYQGGSPAVYERVIGKNGGSGGGAAHRIFGTFKNMTHPGGKGVYPESTFIDSERQGYDGGNATVGGDGADYGAGGGGAGANGVSTFGNYPTGSQGGGNGGIGRQLSITGTAIYYGGGGGGGSSFTGTGIGGLGGGGNGGASSAQAGTVNTGGGGGGTAGIQGGGGGGSGVVIIAYKSNAQTAIGGTVTSYTSGNNTFWVHRFTSTGTFVAPT